MGLFTTYIIETVTEIKTTPEKIWEFFLNIERNYKAWHPEDHNYFRWIKGNPLETGSKVDAKETIGGHKGRIKATVIESEENKKIVFKPAFPISFMCPRLEWLIESNGDNTLFIARSYYRFGKLFLTFKKKAADEILSISQQHMDEEGDNLKKILEGK
jgi:hypothetical protein